MISLRMIAVCLVCTCEFALVTESNAQGTQVDMLLYPIYDDGDGNTLYDAQYCTQTCNGGSCNCTQGSQEYVWAPTGLSTPETCNESVQRIACAVPTSRRRTVVATATTGPVTHSKLDVKLLNPVKQSFTMGSNLNTYNYIDPNNVVTPRIDPSQGFTTTSAATFAYVTTPTAGTIPVKVFDVTWSNQNIGIPNASTFTYKSREVRVAFQVESLPQGMSAMTYTVTQSTTDAKSFSGYFTDNQNNSIFVVTKARLFP